MDGRRVARTRVIAAAPDDVWNALAAFDRIADWAPDADHSSALTDPAGGLGAARRIQAGRTTLVERITVWEPPTTLAYTIEGLPPVVGPTTNQWTLAPGAGRTEVTLTTTVEQGTHPLGRLAAPLAARRLAKASDSMLAGLAAHLEAP